MANKKLRVLGITCGIGSMLQGAKMAGYKVVGNIEWRKYYHKKDEEGRNTFMANYPRAFFVEKMDDLTPEQREDIKGVDLVMGHPECGNFSVLSKGSNAYRGIDKTGDAADIPLFIDMIAEVQPRFFVMDDLPGCLGPFPMEEYQRRLPEYDLFPEWISNYHYGNVQKHRKRFFMIGALKSEKWAFQSGEDPEYFGRVKDVIGDLCNRNGIPKKGIPNNDMNVLDDRKSPAIGLLGPGLPATWKDVQEYFKGKEEGKVLEYHHRHDGSMRRKYGFSKSYWDKHGFVLTGGSSSPVHPLRNLPLNIRERARIQGFPDDFVFYGTRLEKNGKWDISRNNDLIKQTGKAMPIHFCRYVATLVADHVTGRRKKQAKVTNQRCINPSEEIDLAKLWFCENIGYENQEAACEACWLRKQCPTYHESRQEELFEAAGGES